MKRVRTVTANNKYFNVKLTLELTSTKGTIPVRQQFIAMMAYYVTQVMIGLGNLGFINIKQK
jgi:hypothetical protein